MRSVLLVTVVVLLFTGWLYERHHVDGELLGADPDTLAENAPLYAKGVARGQSLFADHCVTCHGAKGTGDPARGVPNLRDDDWLYGTGQVSDIERVIAYGIRSGDTRGWNLAVMPAYARSRPSPTDDKILPLTPADISDLIDMLYHQQGKPADAAASQRGVALYYGRGGCYDCHAADMKGDSAIGAPNLTDGITLYGDGGKTALYNTITNGRQGVCPAWIGTLSPAGMRATSLYVYSLSHPKTSLHVSP